MRVFTGTGRPQGVAPTTHFSRFTLHDSLFTLHDSLSMLRPCNNFILNWFPYFNPVLGKSCNSHHELSVMFRMCLGIF